MGTIQLSTPFTLPCGQILKNRMCKSAMTERIAGKKNHATTHHKILYERWAECNAGLMISGNIMVDKTHLESGGNIVLENEDGIPALQRVVKKATSKGHPFWAQINHSGRQTSILIRLRPKSASNVQLKQMGLFGKPISLTHSEIEDIIQKFVNTALYCKQAGFNGIQIHAAHGYLISQFLSPKTNLRQDDWGGPLKNRSRILVNILDKCRSALGENYPISIKLNSSDFLKGGFSEEDSMEVISMIEDKIDLLEISGGNYEKMQFFEGQQKESTKSREAYFMEFASKIRKNSPVPLMITGGFRGYKYIQEVLANNEVDVIGMARPFCLYPEKISDFIKGEIEQLPCPSVHSWFKPLDFSAEGGYYAKQIIQLAKGKEVIPGYGGFRSANFLLMHETGKAIRRKFT